MKKATSMTECKIRLFVRRQGSPVRENMTSLSSTVRTRRNIARASHVISMISLRPLCKMFDIVTHRPITSSWLRPFLPSPTACPPSRTESMASKASSCERLMSTEARAACLSQRTMTGQIAFSPFISSAHVCFSSTRLRSWSEARRLDEVSGAIESSAVWPRQCKNDHMRFLLSACTEVSRLNILPSIHRRLRDSKSSNPRGGSRIRTCHSNVCPILSLGSSMPLTAARPSTRRRVARTCTYVTAPDGRSPPASVAEAGARGVLLRRGAERGAERRGEWEQVRRVHGRARGAQGPRGGGGGVTIFLKKGGTDATETGLLTGIIIWVLRREMLLRVLRARPLVRS